MKKGMKRTRASRRPSGFHGELWSEMCDKFQYIVTVTILSIDCNVLGDIVAKLLNRNQNFCQVSRLSQGALDSKPWKIRDVSSKEAF